MKKLNFLLILFLITSGSMVVNAQVSKSGPVEADEMFKALGGRKLWADLKSLYIKAKHLEPGIGSYQNEIWRGVDAFKLRIEQQNQDFHKLGLFSEKTGTISYFKRDSSRQLSAEDLSRFRKSNDQNIYVLLSKMAKDKSYIPSINGQRLEFHHQGEFIVAFILNDEKLPVVFITPSENNSPESVSYFNKWHKTNGYVHPAGGGPVGGNFFYVTEVWLPSNSVFEEAFEVKYEAN